MTMTSTFIETNRLCRTYRRGPHVVRAVDEVDLTVSRGEFLAIVGASGSGKSTILSLLAGLDTPTSGKIEIDGVALNSLTRRELSAYRARRIGMVFQSFNLISHHTALHNVELALFFNGTARKERRRRAEDILDRLGLSDRLEHRPADLSGGEQQRVAMARALVKRPDILFADEPTGNLDRENSIQIASLLGELNGSGLTIVMVTHDMSMAERAAHRLVRMDYGRIVSPPTGESDR